MVENRHLITSRQLFAFIISAQIGIGIITLPSQLAKDAGHDGWISMAVTGLISTAAGILIVLLLKRYGNKSIFDINRLLYGKFIGFIFNIMIIIYLLFAASIGIRIFGEFVKITILNRTPEYVLSIFILLPTIYITWFGLKPLSRFLNVIFLILALETVYILLTLREVTPSFLLPVGESGLMTILGTLKYSFFAYIGFELVAIIYPNIKDKDNVVKYHSGANLFSMLFFIFVTAMLTAVFGENMLKQLVIPLFSLTGIYNAPIAERLDLYFTAIWFIAMANSIRAYFFSAYYSITIVFNISKNRMRIYIPYVAAAIILSRLPKDLNDVNRYIEVLSLFSIAVISLFIFCLAFSFINKRGVSAK